MIAATLFTARADGMPLADALTAFAAAVGAEPPALVYAPGWCGFVTVRDGRLVRPDGTEPKDAYEVRTFTKSAELRWLKDARTGDPLAAVVLSDGPLSLDEKWTELVRDTVVGKNEDVSYLLWGRGTGGKLPAAGWSELGTARVGALAVPRGGVPAGGRVVLRAVEYFAADEYGSAYVLDERLTELEAADA